MATPIPEITETITPYSVTPVLNSATFPEDIDTYNGEQPSRITSKNTVNTQINAVIVAMNTFGGEMEIIEQNASDSATASGISATLSQNYANADEDVEVTAGKYSSKHFSLKAEDWASIALNASEYKGDWVAGYETTGYSLGYSVTYTDGKKYVSKLDTNLVEPTSETNTTEWDFLESVSPEELALKAPIASPTFTGTVGGITATMVGLGNVNNTSDASKPVSTATQTALDLKALIADPTFTGTVTAPTIDTPTIKRSSYVQIADASVGATLHTFNYANGDVQQVTFTAAGTIGFSNFVAGEFCTFIIDAIDWGDYTPTNLAAVLNSGADIAFTSGGTDRLLLIKDKDDLYDLVRMIENMGGA